MARSAETAHAGAVSGGSTPVEEDTTGTSAHAGVVPGAGGTGTSGGSGTTSGMTASAHGAPPTTASSGQFGTLLQLFS